MRTKYFLLLSAACLLNLTGCDENSETIQRCSTAEPCASASHVCANGFCIDRCTETSCDIGFYCDNDGLCKKEIEQTPQPDEPDCSDEKTCGEGFVCNALGKCEAVISPVACSEDTECGSGLICEQSACVSAECGEGKSCENGTCLNGRCQAATSPVSCSKDEECGAGLICEKSVCVPVECDENNPCVAEDQYCQAGRCDVQLCHGDAACDAESYCHIAKCIKAEPCQEGTCDGNLVCSKKGLCIPHCKTFACSGDMVCPEDGLCIEPCTESSCEAGQVCNPYGLCVTRCTPESCVGDGVTCGDDGLCHMPECSSEIRCDASYKVCDNYHCVDKCKSNADCADGKACKTNTGLCVDKCTVESCDEGEVCTGKGLCVPGVCSDLVPCAEGNVCNAKHVCVTPMEVSSECYFDRPCLETETDCKAKNKPCADPDKQCNAYNQCILKSEADGLGLGEICDDADDTKKCASDLACIQDKVTELYVCREGSHLLNKKTCTAGLFEDRCVGNIIIECNEDTGRIEVQDCKTDYSDWTVPSTGIFHGEDFYCAKRIDANYVTCVRQCDNEGDEMHICGWDPEYTDIDYSDRYVCQINGDGYQGYFPVDSEVCRSTCEYETGICD